MGLRFAAREVLKIILILEALNENLTPKPNSSTFYILRWGFEDKRL